MSQNTQNVVIEYISLPGTSQQNTDTSDRKWSSDESRVIIDLYAKYKEKVGRCEIKNLKILWQRIATDLNQMGLNVTQNNCLIRWRVLKRGYKKFKDNPSQTGRGRKFFEFEKEMNEVFRSRRNIISELLLEVDTHHEVDTVLETNEENEEDRKESEVETMTTIKTMSKKRKRNESFKRRTNMENVRIDRKHLQEERISVEREKHSIL
ncbi:unnamed protein product [Diabrotica balteata]|uniref:Myb-like domain-containing protein n=1 Tax=Diabrotica balteata TaxID=107213 RepID=A0A9N9TD34_DIABA|nr:unnamed protein product [Diabrotica balteata]